MDPKVQHYVPQFYLRNFANKRKKGYFIHCFDKHTRKKFGPNLKNVASQSGYYDFTDSDGRDVSIETWFQELESKANEAIRALVNHPTMAVLLENRSRLADFIALQDLRTPVFRALHDDMLRAIDQRLQDNRSRVALPTENDTAAFQARFIADEVAPIVRQLECMKWIVMTNRTDKALWTSDNPIFKYNPLEADLVGNLGLMCNGIQLHIPISPCLAIIICDPVAYAHEESEVTAEPPNVDFENSGQVASAHRYLFSVNDEFELVQGMLDARPELSDPKRVRITIA